MNDFTLIGYEPSVYTRSVRMALHAKSVPYTFTPVDPFHEDGQAALVGVHPFGRVPVLIHQGVRIYETTAILEYLDTQFAHMPLIPQAGLPRARVAQVQSIADNYVYSNLVRGVFSNGVYLPHLGMDANLSALNAGLAAAPRVLDALEEIAQEGHALTGRDVTRAECHLGPMIAYFSMYAQARDMVQSRPCLARWCAALTTMDAFASTRPDIVHQIERDI